MPTFNSLYYGIKLGVFIIRKLKECIITLLESLKVNVGGSGRWGGFWRNFFFPLMAGWGVKAISGRGKVQERKGVQGMSFSKKQTNGDECNSRGMSFSKNPTTSCSSFPKKQTNAIQGNKCRRRKKKRKKKTLPKLERW